MWSLKIFHTKRLWDFFIFFFHPNNCYIPTIEPIKLYDQAKIQSIKNWIIGFENEVTNDYEFKNTTNKGTPGKVVMKINNPLVSEFLDNVYFYLKDNSELNVFKPNSNIPKEFGYIKLYIIGGGVPSYKVYAKVSVRFYDSEDNILARFSFKPNAHWWVDSRRYDVNEICAKEIIKVLN